jgi:hypothetical protein
MAVAFTAAVQAHARGLRHWRVVTWAASAMVSDGSRYAAYDTPTGLTRIFDVKRNRWSLVGRPAGYQTVDVGGGQLLWSGPAVGYSSLSRVILLDLRTLAQHVPVGFDAFPSNEAGTDGAYFQRVGRYGMAGRVVGYHSSSGVLFNWRTGSFAYLTFLPYTRPDELEALDRPGLRMRLCRGVRQQPDPRRHLSIENNIDEYFLPLDYDRPYGLTWAGRHGDRLDLLRCGSVRPTVLSADCGDVNPCGEHQLAAGIATWPEVRQIKRSGRLLFRGIVRAYDVTRRKEWSWHALDSLYPGPKVVHTRDRLFVSTRPARRRDLPYPYVIRVAPLPGR